MTQLFPYIKKYLKYIGFAALFLLIEVLAETGIPKIMTLAVKFGVNQNDSGKVMMYGGIMILMAIVGCAGGLLGLRFACKASQNCGADIRIALFDKIQKLSIDKYDASTLILRLGFDVNQIQSLLQMLFRIMVRAPLLFIFALIMASTLNKSMVLIFIGVSVVAGIVIVVITKASFAKFYVAQEKLERVNRILREDIIGQREVRAYTLEKSKEDDFYDASDEYKDKNTKALRWLSLTSPISTMIVNLSAVPIIWFGRTQINAGIMAVEDIIAYTTYTGQVLLAFMMISMVLMLYSKAQVAMDRVCEILNEKDSLINTENTNVKIGKASVSCKNISFKYAEGSGKPVIDNLSFEVKAGQLAAVLGSTGCGKTTLINLLCRLADPTEGEIFIDEKNIKEYTIEDVRNSIIPVMQHAELFSGTIESNISMGTNNASKEDTKTAANHAQISEFIESCEDKYESEVTQKGANLSGGQKQRIALARAFMKNAKLLLLDDSINAVNPSVRGEIMKYIKSLNNTRIIVTQRAEETMDADVIFIMREGRIVASGTHNELLTNCPDYLYFFENKEALNG